MKTRSHRYRPVKRFGRVTFYLLSAALIGGFVTWAMWSAVNR